MLSRQRAVEDLLAIMPHPYRRDLLRLTRPHLVIHHIQPTIVPIELMQRREHIIQLGMKSQTLLMVGICPVFSLPSRAGIVLVLHILASVHILIARRQKESKPVIQQPVPISSRSDDVRQRTS